MRICVFCGSSFGNNEIYTNAAREMGRTLAAYEIVLIYGGGRVGLMGALADAALNAGGAVIGVIPRALSGAGNSTYPSHRTPYRRNHA